MLRLIKELIGKDKIGNCLIKNDVLDCFEAGRELVVVPKNMHSEIIKELHKKSHFTSAKTEEILKGTFLLWN